MAPVAPRVEGGMLSDAVAPDGLADLPQPPTATELPARPPPAGVPLLATKLYVPALRSPLVPRPRLLAQLTLGLRGPLTLLSAPAGFGKTTLLSLWQRAAGNSPVPLAWVSLDAADRDPARFWSYVITALDTLQPGLAAEALPALRLAPSPPIEAVLTRVLNALTALPGDAVLVLDDYHAIDSVPVHTALTFLVDHLPPRLHLVLLTRADPPLPLARLRARGSLTELRVADLRFTPDEVATFLTEVMGLPLTQGEITALEVRTEGWIAGLQLAALAMGERADRAGFVAAFTGSNRFVVDYLVTEVLDRLAPHLQRFVLQTSILERLCGSLCDAVLGVADGDPAGEGRLAPPQSFVTGAAYSQRLLLELERINLFLIPLDDERRWFRYHQLFADVLRERLASGAAAAEIVTLHRRARVWLTQHQLLPEAIQHALAVQDWEQAADLVEQHGRPIIISGQIATVLAWIEALPATLVTSRPRLLTMHAAMLTYTDHFEAAEMRLQSAEAWAQTAPPGDLPGLVLGQVATLRATLVRFTGDLARSVALAHQALDLLPATELIGRAGALVNAAHAFLVHGDVTPAVEQTVLAVAQPARASGNLFATLRSFTLLARLRGMQGRLSEAAATYHQAAQAMPNHEASLPALIGSGDYYAGLGDLLRERHELDRAAQLLRQCLAVPDGTYAVEAEVVTLAYLALARLQQARGDGAGAVATLRRFCDLARQRGFYGGLLRRAAAVEAQIWLAQGQLDAAVGWAAGCGLDVAAPSTYAHEAEYLTLARVQIAQRRRDPGKDLTSTRGMLDRLLGAAEQGARGHSAIEVLALRALGWQAAGEIRSALMDLERALQLAAPEGYVHVFVDEGAPMATLLAQVACGSSAVAAYAGTLLKAFLVTPDVGARAEAAQSLDLALPPQAAALVEVLSARELEVLHLIAGGCSNQAIADQLVIAVGTVKKHVNNIFGKLDVQSRTQALVRARALKLL